MILLLDIGNTRLKWALLRASKLGRMRAARHSGDAAAVATIVRRAPRALERIVAVNVAGPRFERALAAAARARGGVRVEFIRSLRSAGGVRNGYTDTWRLGADRWVSAIGAHALAGRRGVVLANAGTALTVDAVNAGGRHLGGVIVPGPAAMIETMLAGTHGIRRRARGGKSSGRGLFAANTASALASGAAYASAALIDRAVDEAKRLMGGRPLLLLTGGSALVLAPHIKSSCRVVPDLVLRGLAVLARGS
jgi:type III pantothenate kinase